MTRLRIVIVNWNAGEMLRDCVRSIAETDTSGFTLERVVVVDNASTDDSLQGLDEIGLPLEIVRNDINRGFAAACNQGALDGETDYLLFLNPDTRLFADSLAAPLAFMNAEDQKWTGICGIQLVDDSGAVSRSCARFPTPLGLMAQSLGLDKLIPRVFPSHLMTEWDHATTRRVDHVIGAFFLIRTGLFKGLTGFDPRFFVYLEDLDISLRARDMGWESRYFAGARAYHKGGGTSAKVKARRLFYSLQSRILYAFKHFSVAAACGVALVTLLVEPFARFGFCLVRRGGLRCAGETLHGYVLLYRALPGLLRRAARR